MGSPYPRRKQRDAINAKVMADLRLQSMMDFSAMPFDGQRMFWGVSKTPVELDAPRQSMS